MPFTGFIYARRNNVCISQYICWPNGSELLQNSARTSGFGLLYIKSRIYVKYIVNHLLYWTGNTDYEVYPSDIFWGAKVWILELYLEFPCQIPIAKFWLRLAINGLLNSSTLKRVQKVWTSGFWITCVIFTVYISVSRLSFWLALFGVLRLPLDIYCNLYLYAYIDVCQPTASWPLILYPRYLSALF